MRILFTGATGVVGRATLPILLASGHEVLAVTRREEDVRKLWNLGATPLIVDLFDASAVYRATQGVDAVVHMATAIPAYDKMTKRAHWAMNDRLRRETTGLLVDACLEHGVARFVQQSVALVYADGGRTWIDEDAPVDPAWEVMNSALDGESHVMRFTACGGSGVVLRMSGLYGPGRASAGHLEAIARRKVPIVGNAENYISRLHVDDAATAIGAALAAPAGIYNVSDDEPRPVNDELRMIAGMVGARTPRRVPAWLARSLVGRASTLLTVSHRISARRLTRATGWRPAIRSSRNGWPDIVDSWPHRPPESQNTQLLRPARLADDPAGRPRRVSDPADGSLWS